jgi:hypothetical protein
MTADCKPPADRASRESLSSRMRLGKMAAVPVRFSMRIATLVGAVFVFCAQQSVAAPVNAGRLFLAENSGYSCGGVVLVVLIGSTLFAVYASHIRAQKIEALARSLGYTFRGKATAADGELVIGCYLGETGSDPTVSNVMEVARTPELKFILFDYAYTTEGGETSTTTQQTIARMQSPLLKLPSFLLFPETIFSKIKALFGGADVNFLDSPGFSNKYILRGQDEAALRAIFSPALRQALEPLEKLTIEGADDVLFIFRAGSRIKAEELVARIEENKRILALFFEAQQANKARA